VKQGIHPEYMTATVRCSCGEEFTTRATKPEIRVELCSRCHPFYTGKQKLVDSGGRVERYQQRYAKSQEKQAAAKSAQSAKAAKAGKKKA
jgi:large subunit ribosomal protein L31